MLSTSLAQSELCGLPSSRPALCQSVQGAGHHALQSFTAKEFEKAGIHASRMRANKLISACRRVKAHKPHFANMPPIVQRGQDVKPKG